MRELPFLPWITVENLIAFLLGILFCLVLIEIAAATKIIYDEMPKLKRKHD